MSTSSELMPRPSIMPTKYTRIQPLESPTPPPDNELSIFKVAKEVLSSVKPGSDVTNINLPASVLDPVSTLEKTKKSMQRGELMQDVCNPLNDAENRLFNVMRFNISGLSRERFGKKPYNPVLGEVYRCCFVHKNEGGITSLVAEQVSHHPPITALHLRNDTLGFSMNSYTAPEPRFWGNSLEVKLSGSIRLVLNNFSEGEEYIITRPYLYMTGFIAGRQRLEFNGISTFKCEKTGFGAEIEYKAKGAMNYRTEMNGIIGKIFELKSKKTLYTLDGHWDKIVSMTNVETGVQSTLFDYESIVVEKSMVAVLPPENELEQSFSTLVWKECSKAILAGEGMKANAEKRKVEEHERNLKKERCAAKIEWRHHYFCKKNEEGNDGYDLCDEWKGKNKLMADIQVSESELEALKSGQLLEQMMIEMAVIEQADAANGNVGRGSIFRRKLLKRNR